MEEKNKWNTNNDYDTDVMSEGEVMRHYKRVIGGNLAAVMGRIVIDIYIFCRIPLAQMIWRLSQI